MEANLHGNTVGSRQDVFQRNIILGTLLGDGFLELNGKNYRLIADHSAKQKEYVEWKASYLKEFFPSVVEKDRLDRRTGKIYSHVIVRTRASSVLKNYYKLFYNKGKKVIPKKLPRIINWMILAVWIMDDGYKRNDCRALRLNTQGYDKYEQSTIRKSLLKLGIDSNIQKHQDSYCIYIPSKSYSRLKFNLEQYIIPSMKYKIA